MQLYAWLGEVSQRTKRFWSRTGLTLSKYRQGCRKEHPVSDGNQLRQMSNFSFSHLTEKVMVMINVWRFLKVESFDGYPPCSGLMAATPQHGRNWSRSGG